MKLSVILVSYLIAFTFLNQSFAEVYTTGSAADNNGNILVVGYCLGNVRIAGEEFTITTPSSFILKLNSDGEKIWVRFINSTQSIKANAVAVDSFGNIYITGEFSGTANFDSYSLSGQGIDAFIVKYDTQGNADWVKHGTSTNTATGNDIFVKGNFVYVCGYGKPISFDSLTTQGGGYTVIYDQYGLILHLFTTTDNTYALNIDNYENIVCIGAIYNGQPVPYYVTKISKFRPVGTSIWEKYIQSLTALCTDYSLNVYALSRYFNLYLDKLDSSGNLLERKDFGPQSETYRNGLLYTGDENIILSGSYSQNLNFGDTSITSNGMSDAFLAKIDTSLNPIWIRSIGGSLNDELLKFSLLSDGTILTSGNFTGILSIDTLQISGGIGLDDQWSGLVKYDTNGNLIWFKKILENFFIPSTTNWFPLEAGNKWQFFGSTYTRPIVTVQNFLKRLRMLDSSYVNNIKYYSTDGFFDFGYDTKIRYDIISQRLLVLFDNVEYTFMDFSKNPGEAFQQIQNNGTFSSAVVVIDTLTLMNDTIYCKGFKRNTNLSYCFFVPDVGWFYQKQFTNQGSVTAEINLRLIEYVIQTEDSLLHKKHSDYATINFDYVSFIEDTNRLINEFQVLHTYSKGFYPQGSGYLSYIKNAYLQSFYYNGADTIWNNNFNISQTTEIDFSLNYQFDTTKYNNGYHLYYRIAAVDKGIIADTFYSPQTGYYKLFWKDSTTSVTQTEFEALTYSLSQNYPNPFNPVSRIVFTIPKRENVSLKVYDILGSEITTLVNKELDAGKYEVDFSGKELSSGIYIYQIKAGTFRETKKMILMR
jgi:hypothetical protein